MKLRMSMLVGLTLMATLACSGQETVNNQTGAQAAKPTAAVSFNSSRQSAFDTDGTAFGFFPSPPEPSIEAIFQHFEDLGDHADFILIQPNIPWDDFAEGVEGESQARTDLRNQVLLANQNGLETIFVVDPLNGLNRGQFFGLPAGWQSTFADPQVRQAFMNFSLWIVQEFEPKYLGLASEINTYMDAHPDDVDHYLSLYRDTYQQIKSKSPSTQVFVTFQWDDLNNMFPQAAEGRQRGVINWEQVEVFEPQLNLWVISSYPYFVFNGGRPIPADYYTPLLSRTEKPLAVAEGGFTTRAVGPIRGGPQDQVGYLEAIHDQLGQRLDFWVYIILNDLNMEAIADEMASQGRAQRDIDTLAMFAKVGLRQADGTPKPALELWDSYRTSGQ